MDCNFMSWSKIAQQCPLHCELVELGKHHFTQKRDSRGRFSTGKTAIISPVAGELTVTDEANGFRFFHTGLNGGEKFVPGLNADLSPNYNSVYFGTK
ncbi:MAG: hypothetical protein WCV85_01925 [Patescibacteria group bacterium]